MSNGVEGEGAHGDDSAQTVELWAGIESTVNRVCDRYLDQLERSGHVTRASDIRRIAALGAKAVRYPFLWERAQPDLDAPPSFAWMDERAALLRDTGMRTIAGLVHHGSGPRATHLLDPRFPELLAGYARAVAARYPWIDRYTVVNEPVTTARFSGLYGHWYPNAKDVPSFCRCLLHEMKATVLAMRAIREVNPSAELVQTEDYGDVDGSPELAYQVEFQRELRFLGFDLLCGRVTPEHPLYAWLTRDGALTPDELAFFVEHPCPPGVIGLDYYLTSDRYLDVHLERHPPATHGGNGRHCYADTEMVRVRAIGGHAAMLRTVWQRYRLPLAITEAHMGCTREEQLRWFAEAWEAAHVARAEGIDVRAVTTWAVLGSFDWNSLVTRESGHYEPGAFDVRSPRPRPTAIARVVARLAHTGRYDHPVLDEDGWWRRLHRSATPERQRRAIAIVGAGTLGRALARVCEVRGLAHRLLSRSELDITDPQQIERVLAELTPWAVINAAGYVRVDDAEDDAARCYAWNTHGPAALAAACAHRNLPFVTFSSDLVFGDGARSSPYLEHDAPAPLNVYGHSKVLAEERVLQAWRRALVVRTSAFFGPWDEANFVVGALRTLQQGRELRAANDVVVSPTYVPALAHVCLDLLIDGAHGMWHLANRGEVTWAELARRAAAIAKVSTGRIVEVPTHELGLRAKRPLYSALDSGRHAMMPTWESSLHEVIAQLAA